MKKFILKDAFENVIKEVDDSFESYCKLSDYQYQLMKNDLQYQELLKAEQRLKSEIKEIQDKRSKMYRIDCVIY